MLFLSIHQFRLVRWSDRFLAVAVEHAFTPQLV
jgi:hypothetical protein